MLPHQTPARKLQKYTKHKQTNIQKYLNKINYKSNYVTFLIEIVKESREIKIDLIVINNDIFGTRLKFKEQFVSELITFAKHNFIPYYFKMVRISFFLCK